MDRACSTNGEKRILYRILVGKRRRKMTTIHRWVGNIKMDLGEVGWDGMD
jgi:hypothetical protein